MRARKRLAMVMAAVMLLQVPLTSHGTAVFADDLLEEEMETIPDSDLVDEGEGDGMGADEPAPISATGSVPSKERSAEPKSGSKAGVLRVEVTNVMPGKDTQWTAVLKPATASDASEIEWEDEEADADAAFTAEFTLAAREKGGAAQTAPVVFEGVPEGDYTLTVTPDEDGPAYMAYEQEDIRIEAKNITLKLMTGDPQDYGYGADAAEAYGVIMLGDIDGSREIDETDLALLAKAAAGDDAEGGILTDTEMTADQMMARADLNGDDAVDILDIALFARYIGSGLEDQKAKLVKGPLVSAEDIEPAAESNTETQGDSATVAETFSGTADKPLSVAPADGETISEEKPAVIAAEFTEAKEMKGIVIDPVPGSENSITDGEITVTDDDDNVRMFEVKNGKVTEKDAPGKISLEADDEEEEGLLISAIENGIGLLLMPSMTAFAAETGAKSAAPIVIDLGGQVAVKKISIKVTKTLAAEAKLVDISKVEFFDDMADRIPEPELSIPEGLTVENGSESFVLTWKNAANVSGYEVTVSGECESAGEQTGTFLVETNRLEVTGINGADLLNGKDYEVSVCSVNGSWRSPAATTTAHPTTFDNPPAPENVRLEPGYGQIKVSWKQMKDTHDYIVHYREAQDGEIPEGEEQEKEAGTGTSYTITGLKPGTLYEVWLVGRNEHGTTGDESIHYMDRTTVLNPPDVPQYKALNKAVDESTGLTEHTVSATLGTGKIVGDDSATNGNAVIDGDFGTSWYLSDWDAGYYYGNKMPTITLDQEYKMNTVVLIPDENQQYSYSNGRIFYVEDGVEKEARCRMTRRESNGKNYYILTSYQPFTTDQVRLAVCTYGTARRVSVAEVKFYYYDEIEDKVMGLYGDDYHVTLKDGVGQDDILELRAKLEETDEASGEQHPRKDELNRELDNAQKILDGEAQGEILVVDNKDAQSADKHITFVGGLNTYQPLGVTALAGDTLTIYVGGPNARAGESTRLELVEAQYHGDSSAVFVSHGTLSAGINEILVKAADKVSEYERGGQFYIHYTGTSGADDYGVRVIGGRPSAFLDISDETDRSAKLAKAKAYIEEAKNQLANAEAWHNEDHGVGSDTNAKQKLAHDAKNCVYHATDLVSKRAMISSSVDQVLAGLETAAGSSSTDAMAEQLVDTMEAMDQMLTLYYQHKGLSDDPKAGDKNQMPVSRINIRYQRMFYGAFMYAGGKHIGIEWPELAGLMGGEPIVTDANGNYKSGKLFGWGIGHEIGHEINEGAYVTAEVTNNYFAVLAQAEQSAPFNDDVRFSYDDVFKKTTSGTKGKAANVFTQLAMYWQLHLAYDLDGGNYKTYNSYDDQYKSLFWARVDSIVRDNSKAPNSKTNPIDLNTDKDNKLMRLAVAASERNLLELFIRYGYEPNEGTIEYASHFQDETRGLWFANDDLRVEQMAARDAGSYKDEAANATVTGDISYQAGSNEVTVNMSADGDIRYYEVYRSERVKGSVTKRPVGYAVAENGKASFKDVIGSINNRAFTYTVVGYDMWLNPTAEATIGEVKVTHDGMIDKTGWTVTSNLENADKPETDADDPDYTEQTGYDKMIDNSYDTAFTGSVPESAEGTVGDKTAEIILNFGGVENVTGLRYKADGLTFKAYVSLNGADWTEAHMHTTRQDGNSMLAYFDDGTNLYTYDASYMKLVPQKNGAAVGEGTDVTVYELSVLGQTGDNVDIDADGIGILSEDYVNGSAKIEKGSLVFTGTYKGNPAYNAVLLWDETGSVAGGADEEGTVYAEQIIFAPQPEDMLGEVSAGRWVYYVTPEHAESAKAALAGKRVRAELYRVDDALTNAGERLVSSTVFVDVPADLPEIKLSTGGAQ